MATKEELLQDKRLINVSNLVQYTSKFKEYLDTSLSKKQDVLENGNNIAVLGIDGRRFPLIGPQMTDLTDSIIKTIKRNFLIINNNTKATDFTNATIIFSDVVNAFQNGIEQYIGISWKKYNDVWKKYTPVYLYFTSVDIINAQWTKFNFISTDGIYTIDIHSDLGNSIIKTPF